MQPAQSASLQRQPRHRQQLSLTYERDAQTRTGIDTDWKGEPAYFGDMLAGSTCEIRTKKDGNPFGSPDRNCEKL